ncbi:MAG: HD domain-containing protein [Eubacterium sp.]|nr:HD domain-containing protein [Eubacterium sp.]
MDQDRLDRQMNFILEIDQEKNILRQTHLSRGGRRENDAEHAWHMAIMTWLLAEYSNQEIDVAKTMLMTLVHDLVEIDAGDTYAYDTAAKETEAAREQAAADRIFGLLPADQGSRLREIWEEFNAYETPEARFAHVMDNLQPMLLNNSNGGGDWKEHGIRRSQTEQRNALTHTGSEEIWAYMKKILDKNEAEGSLLHG